MPIFEVISKWWSELDNIDKLLYGVGGIVSIASTAAISAAVVGRGDQVKPSFEKFQGGVALGSLIWELIDTGYLKKYKGKNKELVEEFREGIDQLFDNFKIAASADDLKKITQKLVSYTTGD